MSGSPGRKYLTRLVVENFQSHRLSELSLSPGLNVITGRSDEGKSALIRALRWLLYNEPAGTFFVRRGESATRVAVWFSEGTKIVREREGGRNRYLLFPPGEKVPQRWEGFGSRVPQEILQAHGMQKLLLDEGREVSLNLADQLEEAFLLSEPATVKAKAIGALTGVHVVDAAIRLAEGEKREAERRRELEARRVREMEEKLSAYSDLEEEEKRQKEAENLCRLAGEFNSRREKIALLVERARRLDGERQIREREREAALASLGAEAGVRAAEEAVRKLRQVKEWSERWQRLSLEAEKRIRYLRATARLPEAEKLWERAEKAWKRGEELRRIAERWRRLARETERLETEVRRLRYLPEAAEMIAEAERISGRGSRIREAVLRLRRWEEEYREAERKMKLCREAEEEAAGKYLSLLERAGRCPLCGSPVKREILKEHLEEVLSIG